MTQFQQNAFLTVILIVAAAYFAHLGKTEVALACVGIIAALWRHSGRDAPPGGNSLGLAILVLASPVLDNAKMTKFPLVSVDKLPVMAPTLWLPAANDDGKILNDGSNLARAFPGVGVVGTVILRNSVSDAGHVFCPSTHARGIA